MDVKAEIDRLKAAGNFRRLPCDSQSDIIDLSANDYLGLGTDLRVRSDLMQAAVQEMPAITSSASRLLAGDQGEYARLEDLLSDLYHGRKALMFNSGYHANTGIVSALADRNTVILADKLVHASIIDGAVLSRAALLRWRHADYGHLAQLLGKYHGSGVRILIIAESVYSMDGDRADIGRLIDIKKQYSDAMLYIDEAHAFGVEGKSGLGLVNDIDADIDVDVLVGTFGKAIASVGAFVMVSEQMRHYLINKARSLIFSTALPPVNAMWTRMLVERMIGMDAERRHLRLLGEQLGQILGTCSDSHIQPLIVGDAKRAVELSALLLDHGIKVLPIRTPTVPAGTERLRFSLSAALSHAHIHKVGEALKNIGTK